MALAVDPSVLRTAGAAVVAVADGAHTDASTLSGSAGADAASANGFAAMTAVLRLEEGWQGAVDALGAKLATAGDNLTVNATSYASAEATNKSLFPAV